VHADGRGFPIRPLDRHLRRVVAPEFSVLMTSQRAFLFEEGNRAEGKRTVILNFLHANDLHDPQSSGAE
jgi:hypothetical protein